MNIKYVIDWESPRRWPSLVLLCVGIIPLVVGSLCLLIHSLFSCQN